MKSDIYCIGKMKFAVTKDHIVYELFRGRWTIVSRNKSKDQALLSILDRAAHTVVLETKMEDWVK